MPGRCKCLYLRINLPVQLHEVSMSFHVTISSVDIIQNKYYADCQRTALIEQYTVWKSREWELSYSSSFIFKMIRVQFIIAH